MQKPILILICIISSFQVTGQSQIDSLFATWKNNSLPDSVRVVAFNNYITKKFTFSNPDSAAVLAEELLLFSEERAFKRGILMALNIKGITRIIEGDYIEAINIYQERIRQSLEMNDQKGLAGSYGNIGIVYKNLADYPNALEYYEKSLSIKMELGDERGTANTLNNIGSIYLLRDDHSKALEYFEESLQVKERIGDQRGIANTLGNIGMAYDGLNDHTNARSYFERSLKLKEEIGDVRGTIISLNNIGRTFRNLGDNREAIHFHERSFVIASEIGDQAGQIVSLNNIGFAYLNMKSYPLAVKNCRKAYDMSKEMGEKMRQKESCQCLYTAFKEQGNSIEALNFHEELTRLTNEMQSNETSKKLQQIEFAKQILADSLRQEEENRIIEIAHQEEVRKKEQTRNLALGGGFFFLLLAGGFFSRWQYVKKSKAIIEKEKERSENLLLNILPFEIAEELKANGKADARDFDMVSILFTDFVDFTKTSEQLSAVELVSEINTCFKAFDEIIGEYQIEKIKTIGDAYMAAGGLPVYAEASVRNTVFAALKMQDFIKQRKLENQQKGLPAFEMRVGIHTGPVVAGIVGVKKFQYDIWGDTVNTASRMESGGAAGRINISQKTYDYIKDDSDFQFEKRGRIEVKGKGEMDMWFVSRSS